MISNISASKNTRTAPFAPFRSPCVGLMQVQLGRDARGLREAYVQSPKIYLSTGVSMFALLPSRLPLPCASSDKAQLRHARLSLCHQFAVYLYVGSRLQPHGPPGTSRSHPSTLLPCQPLPSYNGRFDSSKFCESSWCVQKSQGPLLTISIQ